MEVSRAAEDQIVAGGGGGPGALDGIVDCRNDDAPSEMQVCLPLLPLVTCAAAGVHIDGGRGWSFSPRPPLQQYCYQRCKSVPRQAGRHQHTQRAARDT